VNENKRTQAILLKKKVFPNYFPSSKEFKNEILDWIKYDTEITEARPQ
jgi:hypothetical protein